MGWLRVTILKKRGLDRVVLTTEMVEKSAWRKVHLDSAAIKRVVLKDLFSGIVFHTHSLLTDRVVSFSDPATILRTQLFQGDIGCL